MKGLLHFSACCIRRFWQLPFPLHVAILLVTNILALRYQEWFQTYIRRWVCKMSCALRPQKKRETEESIKMEEVVGTPEMEVSSSTGEIEEVISSEHTASEGGDGDEPRDFVTVQENSNATLSESCLSERSREEEAFNGANGFLCMQAATPSATQMDPSTPPPRKYDPSAFTPSPPRPPLRIFTREDLLSFRHSKPLLPALIILAPRQPVHPLDVSHHLKTLASPSDSRRRAIALTKTTQDYIIAKKSDKCPATPELSPSSKRRFDIEVAAWRRRVHDVAHQLNMGI